MLFAEAINVGERQVHKESELVLLALKQAFDVWTQDLEESQERKYPGNYQQSDIFYNPGDDISESQHGERVTDPRSP